MHDADCLDRNRVILAPMDKEQDAEDDDEKLELQYTQEDNSNLGLHITAEFGCLSAASNEIKLEGLDPDLPVPVKLIPDVKYDDRTKLQRHIKEESVDSIMDSFRNNTGEEHHGDASNCISKKEFYYEREDDDFVKEDFPDIKQEQIISEQRWQEAGKFAYNETSYLLSDETNSSDIRDPRPNQHEPPTRNRKDYLNKDYLEIVDDDKDWTAIAKSHSVEQPFVSSDSTSDSVISLQTSGVCKPYYPCTFCDKVFNNKSHLTRHVRIHTGEKPFLCPDCGKRFSDNSVFIAHSRRHSGVKHLPCPYCEMRFSGKSGLTRHITIHLEEEPFSCSCCAKKFNHKCKLTRHTLTHTGQKPFACQNCNKKFSDKSNLARHMHTHTGVKSFACCYCQKKFNQSTHLTTHLRKHTGEKPYLCSHCGKGYTDKRALIAHSRKHCDVNCSHFPAVTSDSPPTKI